MNIFKPALLFVVAFAANQPVSSFAQVTAAISRGSFNSPDKVFPNADALGDYSKTGEAHAVVADEYVSPSQTVTASAEGSLSTTTEGQLIHPVSRVSATMRGADGNLWTVATARVTQIRRVVAKPKNEFSILDFGVKSFEFDLYDKGNLVAPQMPRAHSGGHRIKFDRRFSLGSVRELSTNLTLGITALQSSSDPERVIDRLDANSLAPQTLTINNPAKIKYSLIDPIPFVNFSTEEGIYFELNYSTAVEINFIHFLGNTAGLAAADFSNTSGIRNISIFDENGNNVSDDLSFFDLDTDRQLFVPAPELLGDCNLDGVLNFLDISPFISILSGGSYLTEADINQDGVVTFLDIGPFVALLSS